MYLKGALHCLNGFVTQVRVLKENRKNVTYRQTDRLTDRRTDGQTFETGFQPRKTLVINIT